MQMKISPWISCLIQSTLIKEPVLTHNQDMQLERSNRELAAIGRNLNQIARSMHQNLNHNIELSLSEIELLKKAVETNKLAIREIVAVSQQRWGYFDK
nr:plasmid mobilization relaxosome protein MobC [uncultured Undibacterium sp.]